MKRVRINLARPGRAWMVLAWLMVVVLLALSAVGAWLAWAASQEAQSLRSATAALQRRVDVPPAENSAPPLHADDAFAWARLATSDVDRVLEIIESAQVPGVRVVRLDVDAQTRRVTVEIEAPDHAQALKMFDLLNGQTGVVNWRIGKSQTVPPSGAQMSIIGGW